MADIRELLLAAARGQRNVQTGMPVIPNNGNPGGAYNTSPEPPSTAIPNNDYDPVNGYSWMRPSPSMDLIHQMLAAPIQQPQPPQQRPVPPMQLAPPVQPTANPVLPHINNGIASGPMANTEAIIMPNMPGAPQVLPNMPTRGLLA